MGSPGWISFEGLGEPIQQMRQFIKDIWYRNRQESRRGDQEIEQEAELHRLELARQHLQLQANTDHLVVLTTGVKDQAGAVTQEQASRGSPLAGQSVFTMGAMYTN
jgi:hypothetical protein